MTDTNFAKHASTPIRVDWTAPLMVRWNDTISRFELLKKGNEEGEREHAPLRAVSTGHIGECSMNKLNT
jgi:hypothetical protein